MYDALTSPVHFPSDERVVGFPAQDISFNMASEAKTFSELKTMPIRQASGEMSDDNAAIPSFDPADVCWSLEVAEAMSDSI